MADIPNCAFVRSDREVREFQKKYIGLILKACESVGLPDYDTSAVIQDIMIKFGQNRLGFKEGHDSKAKFTSYLFRVAQNQARDILRKKRNQHYVDMEGDEEKFESVVGGSEDKYAYEQEDGRVLIREALRRLMKDCSQRTLEILARNVISEEQTDALAEEYEMGRNNVSVIKTRWLPLLEAYLKQVNDEDMAGELKMSSEQVDFLKKFVHWL